MTEPLLMSARDAFRQIGIGRDAGYRLVAEGRLRAVHVSGRRILVPRSELAAFIERELGEEVMPSVSVDEQVPETNVPRL